MLINYSGQKGQRGDKGDSGTPRLASHMNWKECAWKKGDGKDSGLIYVSEQYPCAIIIIIIIIIIKYG